MNQSAAQGFSDLAIFGPLSLTTALSVVVTLVFIWWLIFTAVAIYHWFRYARDSWLTVPLIALHLFVSAWIFVFAIGGLH